MRNGFQEQIICSCGVAYEQKQLDKYDDENEERVIYYKGKSANVHPIRSDPCCR